MDTMITMMEKYTDHLEDIVAERTAELAAEKAKTDELLFRMLPKLVVLSLLHCTLVSQTLPRASYDGTNKKSELIL